MNSDRPLDNIWFDIEKSQERYEALLDSYQGIIKDKENQISKLEDEMMQSKREKYEIEDLHFRNILEKDRVISDLNVKIDS